MDQNGPAMDILSGLIGYANMGMAGMQASEYANQYLPSIPTPAWYRGVFSDDDLEDLRLRTRERQIAALANLKASGKSLLVTPVKRRDSVLK
jgi:hypothetical protein